MDFLAQCWRSRRNLGLVFGWSGRRAASISHKKRTSDGVVNLVRLLIKTGTQTLTISILLFFSFSKKSCCSTLLLSTSTKK